MDLQSGTVAAQVERSGLGPQPRRGSLTGGDETQWSGGETVADDPEQQHRQSDLAWGSAFEKASGGESDVEQEHGDTTAKPIVSIFQKV